MTIHERDLDPRRPRLRAAGLLAGLALLAALSAGAVSWYLDNATPEQWHRANWISGRIYNPQTGASHADVLLAVEGAVPGAPVYRLFVATDADGRFRALVPYNWTGRVTPLGQYELPPALDLGQVPASQPASEMPR